MVNFSAMRYLYKVRCCLPCPFRMKEKIMEQVKHNVENYLMENPSVNYQNLVDRFGEAQQIASAYLDEMESGSIVETIRIKRSIVKIIAGAVALALTIWLFYAVACFIYVADQSDGTIETYIEILEDTKDGVN